MCGALQLAEARVLAACGAGLWQRARMSSQPAQRALGKSTLFGAGQGVAGADQGVAGAGQGVAGSGFVKIAREGKTQGGRKTRTQGAQRSTAEWQRSEAGQQRLREWLKSPELEGWQRRKIEMKLKLGEAGWEPEKKIAASSMEKIRLLNAEFPEQWTMERLSEQFKISQEAVRRILKSKFRPSTEQAEKRERVRKQQIDAFKEGSHGARPQ
ncbi:Required for respiratory growth protein 9 mitochondrial [Coemansia biformis]|uniref:Required for respiratory growth protein 9, mitochondrial n=1 Tax=Coemansia biformis TaxID=1286918 RepID=A0A9W8CX89_9FUNG|nr:Required for respiratory growth protein 9 mitochondrial [Coemansia biformis]